MTAKARNSLTWAALETAIAVVGLTALAGISSVDAAETFRLLKGSEIRTKLAGMEFTDEVHWALVFGRDGTLITISMGKKSMGRWRVKQDQLCLERSAEDQRCYAVWSSRKALQLREPGLDVYEEGVVQRPAARN